MNYNYWLTRAGGSIDMNLTSSQGSVRADQKHGNDKLSDSLSGPEAVARKRLALDNFTATSFPARPNLSSLTNTSSSLLDPLGEFPHLQPKYSFRALLADVHRNANKDFVMNHAKLGGGAPDIELSGSSHHHSVGSTSFPRYSNSTGFAGLDIGGMGTTSNTSHYNNLPQINRLLQDGIFTKATMFPSHGPRNKDVNNIMPPLVGCSKSLLIREPIENNTGTLFMTELDNYLNHVNMTARAIIRYSGTNPQVVSHGADLVSLTNSGTTVRFGISADDGPSNAASIAASSSSGTKKRKSKDARIIFPTNVKNMVATGIFDEVPIKYVSWDREKSVRGSIKGTRYVCWCKDCNKTQTFTANGLEKHAGGKSKHPNDHIYFPNGKSIYSAVQELQMTPSDKLLDVIPTIAGYSVNKENFAKWKESYQATATNRELLRLFGSDHDDETAPNSKE